MRPTQPHWPTAVLVSVRIHVSCLDEGRMQSTVLECIGTAGGAGMPVLARLSLSVPLELPVSITDKGQATLIFKQIRSWGCCNSRMFSWSPGLRTEQKKGEIKIYFEDYSNKTKEGGISHRKIKIIRFCKNSSYCAVHSYLQLCAISSNIFWRSLSFRLTIPPPRVKP